MTLQTAVFAAGCFWGVQAFFDDMAGVKATRVGYTGGHTEHPGYEEVCSGRTGHAEALEITYDGDILDYKILLDAFFKLHDPTQLNRQGPDIGTQYRSAIFVADAEQCSSAETFINQLTSAKRFNRPVVTTIEPLNIFWTAEDYHQKYLERRGLASCHINS